MRTLRVIVLSGFVRRIVRRVAQLVTVGPTASTFAGGNNLAGQMPGCQRVRVEALTVGSYGLPRTVGKSKGYEL